MAVFVTFYMACSVLSYGIAFAHFQNVTREQLARRNKVTAAIVSVLGPCSLLIALGCTRFARDGIRFRH
ncbi:MAG: hypothetical protein JSU72_14650 [Deltaproteobacteria bacterium]|nr:MAG: hypothetical protein JSU72_14650 [Deltaproteobacteria bacterium]